MSKEVWATYSVQDHLQPRALAADIMLFDRLVFPVPAEAIVPAGADQTQPTTVTWKPNEVERKRWEENGWEPDRQKKVLELIEPVVRRVPWDSTQQERWRKEMATNAAHHAPDYAFSATRTILTQDLPRSVRGVSALGPVYRSFNEMKQETGIQSADRHAALPESALAAVLRWEFVTPQDEGLPADELLKRTVAFVTEDKLFRDRREKFRDWQQKFVFDGLTDWSSIESAVKDMHDLLTDLKVASRKLKVRNVVRYASWIAPAAVSVTGALMHGYQFPFALGGAFVSLGVASVNEWFLKRATDQAPAHAAFVHDARRQFGLT